MDHFADLSSRRRFLRTATFGATFGAAAASSLFTVRGLFAEELLRTPEQTEGPFYPVHLPLDTDNDLIVVNDAVTPALGEITHLSGRLLDAKGNPVKNALVEIWQVDQNGSYLHEKSAKHDVRDTNFQGFGRFLTSSAGEYYFRTIKPVVYPDRPAPHIHFAIKMKGREKWTTQCYIKGHPGNEKDFVYQGIKDAKARESVAIDFAPVKGSRIGELAAKFDIVLGVTPEDAEAPAGSKRATRL